MTPPPTITQPRPEVVTRQVPSSRAAWAGAATTADHKGVAKLYLGTSLTFLAAAAVLFALTRIHLLFADSTIMEPEIFNRISSAANVTAIVLFAVPFILGVIGYVAPLQVGARTVALPRLNQLSYWLYAMGALVIFASFLYTVPEVGLAPFPPLGNEVFSPSNGVDAWIGGVGLATLGFVCFAVNLVVTLHTMRAPGMAWRRTPILAWAGAAIGYLLLVIGPLMLAALTMLVVDRHFDGIFFDAGEDGEPLYFAHLAWIFFTGCHTIVMLGAVGVISEIVPTFARKPLFSHRAVGASVVAIAVLGFFAWMQNLYSAPIAPGFAYLAMAAAVGLLVPVGLVLFTWIATIWEGGVRMRAPMSLAIAATTLMVIALAGQLMTAVIPVGWQLENTVAGQQDTVLFLLGAAVLGGFAAMHYWLPKMTGRTAGEGVAKLAAALIVIGALVYGTAMFLAGLEGQPVDVYRYPGDAGLTAYNVIASIGAIVLVLGILIELGNLAYSWNNGRRAGHDPWGGTTLEWFALSPPPPHNFDLVPDVRGPEPLRDIREAIRNREAAFVPPTPLPVTTPPEPEVAADEAATPDADEVAPDDEGSAGEPAEEAPPAEAASEASPGDESDATAEGYGQSGDVQADSEEGAPASGSDGTETENADGDDGNPSVA